MQIHSPQPDAVMALKRLEALLNGLPFPDPPAAETVTARQDPAPRPPADEAATEVSPAAHAVAAPHPRRRSRAIGVAALLAGLAVLGATVLSGGSFDMLGANAATLTAAIGDHLKSRL